jgi:hypothetical protein
MQLSITRHVCTFCQTTLTRITIFRRSKGQTPVHCGSQRLQGSIPKLRVTLTSVFIDGQSDFVTRGV